ncbi:MAG: hypothetical protein GXO22_01435 [Aquificae bacterium]|nr:hypothetical protein [Aquificota bacterium]
MKILYILLILLALVSFIKMSLYLGFMALGIMIGIFLYSYFSKKVNSVRQIHLDKSQN